MRKGIAAATAGEYPGRIAQRESVPFTRERSNLTRIRRRFGRPGALLPCRQIFGARPARSNTGVFSILSGAAPEGVSSAARRNDSVVASSPSTVSLAALRSRAVVPEPIECRACPDRSLDSSVPWFCLLAWKGDGPPKRAVSVSYVSVSLVWSCGCLGFLSPFAGAWLCWPGF
jgi:hypothetical protein